MLHRLSCLTLCQSNKSFPRIKKEIITFDLTTLKLIIGPLIRSMNDTSHVDQDHLLTSCFISHSAKSGLKTEL